MTKSELKQILETTVERGYCHIPSALSWFDFMKVFVKSNYDCIPVLGKFWGAQIFDIIGKPNFVNNNQETIADTLGFATGIALTKPNKPVVCILSDSVFQSGYIYEALNIIIHYNLNVMILVDYNNFQVMGNVDKILGIDMIINGLKSKILVKECSGHNQSKIKETLDNTINLNYPRVVLFKTIKGHGIPNLENDPEKHYLKINKSDIDILVQSSYLND